jgi:flagellar basal-body rod protein FlgG
MMRSLDIGATGMLAQQTNVDVISNNIANMTTAGYKRRRVSFQDLIYQNIDRPGSTSSSAGTTVPTGIQLGLGVRTGAVYREHGQGALRITENPLDLAITGEGFFQIQTPEGDIAYTRDGTFQMNENGELVNIHGFLLDPGITIPADATSIDINEEGEVLVSVANQTATQNVGQIQLANFVNPAGLEAIGDNLYLETDASGSPTTGNPGSDEFGRIRQAAIESSNVNVVEEITTLITAQRAYEMNSTVISTSDEMLQTVTQLR